MDAITVVLASHNRLAFLQSALESVWAQDYPRMEVLVVDDGSEEETRAWLASEEKQQARLQVHFQQQSGVGKARRMGVTLARTPLMTILDSDDLLACGALTRIGEFMEQNPEVDLLYGDIETYRSDGHRSRRKYRQWGSNQSMQWATLLLPKLPFKHSGTSFRREIALEVGNYDGSLGRKIDIDFFLKFLTQGKKLAYLGGKPLVIFHMHGESISRNRVAGLNEWRVIMDRYAPGGPLGWSFRVIRTMSELLKSVYEKVLVR
jgi:glycosyltransferase involved in cell wall biosynthesis